MAYDPIDDLQIKIAIEASKAASGLKDIAKELRTLATDTGKASKTLQGVADAAKDMGKSTSDAAKDTEKLDDAVEKTGKDVEEAGKKADRASKGGLSNFFAMVRRIAVYRAIRSALKFLTNAIREGFEMFSTWDKEQNNYMAGTAANVEKLSEKWTMLKGQIGALGGALFNSLAPAITWVVDKLTSLVDLLQMVIRSLQGEYTYYKLIYKSAEATTGQAKALKRILFGFDELNVLNSLSGGGASISGGSWEYEPLPINNTWLNKIADFSNKIKEATGLSDDWHKTLSVLIPALVLLGGGKVLGGLLGLLPGLISGFKQKNTSLADQTSKVTQDATATQGLATSLGTALGAATLFSLFIGKNPFNLTVNKPALDFSDYETTINEFNQFCKENNINVQVNMPEVSFTETETEINKAKQYAKNNPVNVQVNNPTPNFAPTYSTIASAKVFAKNNPITMRYETVANLQGLTDLAVAHAASATYYATNPIPMSFSLPATAVLGAAVSLRNTLQGWFNDNVLRIPIALGKGTAQGYGNRTASLNASALAGSGVASATSAVSRGSTVASVEKQIQDTMLAYESDLWHQGGTLGKAVGTIGGGLLASLTGGSVLATGALAGSGLLASILPLFGLAGSFASGGTIPNTGSLFYAGEAGAEVVANMGHSTGVMNVSQMQEAVASGNVDVVNAVYAIGNMLSQTINSKNFDVYMDSAKVGQSVSKYQYNQARRGMQGAY